MEDKLKEYGFKVRWSDDPDREVIDFSIEDDEDNIAWVWGSNPFNDVQIECNHPSECVIFDDDEPVGECAICGATCDCHYEADDGNVENYYWSGRTLVPHEWYAPKQIGGIVGDYIKQLQREF